MGYIASSTTTTVTARLTPYGRKQLLSNNNIISYFSLGDSDANYYTNQVLTSGQVPGSSGDLNSNSGSTNSIYNNISIRNKLVYNSNGDLFKPVGSGSFNVNEVKSYLGTTTITGDNLTQNVVLKTNLTGDSLVNLFVSFGLPVSNNDLSKFTITTDANYGYSDTAVSGLSASKILVISIPNTQYGEIIDGKTIELGITTTAGTYTCYSTFQRGSTNLAAQDANIRETSSKTTPTIGDNIAFLFSDNIKKPNNDTTKSWGTGYGQSKPFSVGGKELFNYTSNVASSYTADTAIGVTYLDKGFIVITDPTIVDSFLEATDTSATTLTFNSMVTDISQSIGCDALVSEFRKSTNPTFSYGIDVPRVTEIGLYDESKNLIAVGKLNPPHLLNNMYFRIEVKISV